MQFRIGNHQISRSDLALFFKTAKEAVIQKFIAIKQKANDTAKYLANLIHSFSSFIYNKGQSLAQRILPSRVQVIRPKDLTLSAKDLPKSLKRTEEDNNNTPAPVVNTEAPVVNTEAPGANTEAPVVNTEAPGANTEAPGAKTEAPSAPIEESATNTTSSAQASNTRRIQAGIIGGAFLTAVIAARSLMNYSTASFRALMNKSTPQPMPSNTEAAKEDVSATPVENHEGAEIDDLRTSSTTEDAANDLEVIEAVSTQAEAPKVEEAKVEVETPKAEEAKVEVEAPKAEEAKVELKLLTPNDAPNFEDFNAAKQAEAAVLAFHANTPAEVKAKAINDAIANIMKLRENNPNGEIHWNELQKAVKAAGAFKLGISSFSILAEYSEKTGEAHEILQTTAGSIVTFAKGAAQAAASARLRP